MRTVVFNRARAWSLVVHRYVGLAMATFLLVAGITGTLIAFYVPLDTLLNPVLFVAEHPPEAPMLDPFALKEALERQLPPGSEPLNGVSLHIEPGKNVNFWIDGHEMFVNPYSGKIAGKRRFGELSGQFRQGLMTFIYELHFTLGLGDVGRTVFGVVALLWTLDCFVGAYLTFPLAKQGGRATQRSWLSRWLPTWLLKTNKLFTGIFTWHRASGLGIWMSLLIFAWSAVALNLGEVYEPVMAAVFGQPPEHELPELASHRKVPPIGGHQRDLRRDRQGAGVLGCHRRTRGQHLELVVDRPALRLHPRRRAGVPHIRLRHRPDGGAAQRERRVDLVEEARRA